MKTQHPLSHIPGFGWVNAKLSRKMIVTLVTLAVFGWLYSFGYLLHDVKDFMGFVYDEALNNAQNRTQQVASFLEGSQGDYSGLMDYLDEHQLGCTLKDGSGRVVFHYMPKGWTNTHLTATSGTTVRIPGEDPYQIHVWAPTLDRDDLVNAVGRKTLTSLALFNVGLFLAAGILLYVLLVAPIIDLRRTIQAYSEEGSLPQRSHRKDEVGRLQNSFADLIGLLRAKEQQEHRLIASISHDIKTPLTSVLGYSERLLNAQVSTEKQRQYCQSIHDKGLAIKGIVDGFDVYLDAGLKEDLPLSPLTAGELCHRLRQEYTDELEDAGVPFTVTCDCPQVEFMGNLPHLFRCFGNFIGNAIQHAEAPDLKLDLHCFQDDGYLTLEFADNGTGVPPALLQQIFEPLYTTDRGRKVSGLGLSICRSIIQSHGGTVTASNRDSGGLLIRILLPIPSKKK